MVAFVFSRVSYTADEKVGMEGGSGRTSIFSRERDFMRS